MVESGEFNEPDFVIELADAKDRINQLEGKFFEFGNRLEDTQKEFSNRLEDTQKYSLWIYRLMTFLLGVVIAAILFLIVKEIFPRITSSGSG